MKNGDFVTWKGELATVLKVFPRDEWGQFALIRTGYEEREVKVESLKVVGNDFPEVDYNEEQSIEGFGRNA